MTQKHNTGCRAFLLSFLSSDSFPSPHPPIRTMAEFSENYSCFMSSSLPFPDMMDPAFELLSYLPELGDSAMELGAVDCLHPSYLPEFSLPLHDVLLGLLNSDSPMPRTVAEQKSVSTAGEQSQGDRKRKETEAHDSVSQNCGDAFSENGLPEAKTRKKNSLQSSTFGNKKRSNSKEKEKPKEVVHVRARRGQATDSHSLAERVRREKINERMRYLQDLVPGCCKTMGMAGMLDEIINYVQSLQNQIEFLSMKLSAASSFYDYNLDVDTPAAVVKAPPQQVGSSAYYIDAPPERNRTRDMVEEMGAHQQQQQAPSTLPCAFDPSFGPWLEPCL